MIFQFNYQYAAMNQVAGSITILDKSKMHFYIILDKLEVHIMCFLLWLKVNGSSALPVQKVIVHNTLALNVVLLQISVRRFMFLIIKS